VSTTGVAKWLTASPLADRLGCDVRHLSRLVDKGVLTCRPSKRGREYPWPESREAYLRYQIAEAVGTVAGRNDEVISLDKERALLVRAQRLEVELRLDEKAKKLVPYLWLLESQESLIARLAGVVNNWSDRWQHDLVGLTPEQASRRSAEQEAQLRKSFFEITGDAEEETKEPDPDEREDESEGRAA
jgi:hypothetical protein